MNETDYYIALALIAAAAGAAFTVEYLAVCKADMLRATILLLIASAVIGTAGLAYHEVHSADEEALPPMAAPATTKVAPKPVVPGAQRRALPSRKYSMSAYLVV